jgi:hypothetical protein
MGAFICNITLLNVNPLLRLCKIFYNSVNCSCICVLCGYDFIDDGVRPCLRTAATNGPIVHPRVICEHGEPWWWWRRLGITPDSSTRAPWKFYQQRHLGQVGGINEGVRILRISNWNTSRVLQHAVKSYDMGPPALLPIRRKLYCGFLSPLKINRLGRVWIREPWVQWQAH